MNITDWQKNIIIGSILGGSSIIKSSKNCYFSIRSRNKLWLEYKIQELNILFEKKYLKKDKKTYRCNSKTCEVVSEFYNLLYKEKKRFICDKILHPMKDIGLAVWFLDSGGKCGRNNKNIFLNTTLLKEKGSDLVVKYFNEMEIFCSKSSTKNRIRIIFNVESSSKFIHIIKDKVPLFMMDRL